MFFTSIIFCVQLHVRNEINDCHVLKPTVSNQSYCMYMHKYAYACVLHGLQVEQCLDSFLTVSSVRAVLERKIRRISRFLTTSESPRNRHAQYNNLRLQVKIICCYCRTSINIKCHFRSVNPNRN